MKVTLSEAETLFVFLLGITIEMATKNKELLSSFIFSKKYKIRMQGYMKSTKEMNKQTGLHDPGLEDNILGRKQDYVFPENHQWYGDDSIGFPGQGIASLQW